MTWKRSGGPSPCCAATINPSKATRRTPPATRAIPLACRRGSPIMAKAPTIPTSTCFTPSTVTSRQRLVFCADVRKPGVDWALVRRIAGQWRRAAPLFLGDFYPLIPYNLDPTLWMAWQFDVPEKGEGMIQAFRRSECIYEVARFRLRGLDPAARYTGHPLDSAIPRRGAVVSSWRRVWPSPSTTRHAAP